MAIIPLRAWYLPRYEPIRHIENRPHDLRLSKNSLLKSALRADFLEDVEDVKRSLWLQRYLEGEIIEFYIEGSGNYIIANIDLNSHDIYFTKQETLANLDPTLFFAYQTDFSESGDVLREELQEIILTLNRKSRFPLVLEESHRLTEGPTRINSTLLRKIRRCLLFIADTTPLAAWEGTPRQLVPSPKICVEVGYALTSKREDQVMLVQMERPDMPGQFPFDISNQHRLLYKNKEDLHLVLPDLIETQLQRFNLFP